MIHQDIYTTYIILAFSYTTLSGSSSLVIQYYFFVLYCYFFFFQAEDGIRDADVTGVQTCALPIWRLDHRLPALRRLLLVLALAAQTAIAAYPEKPIRVVLPYAPGGSGDVIFRTLRSEERRVGKECSSRWSRRPYKRRDEKRK